MNDTLRQQPLAAGTRAPAADQPVGWGAAIIDERGNEVPITESMIQRACDQLDTTWAFPRLVIA